MQTVGQERLEEKGEVGSIVTAVDDTNYLLMDIVISDIAGGTSVEMVDESEEMPEDLSTKHRTVSVQTETKEQERFEQLFDGFPQDQIRYFMNILIHFASKKDLGNIKNELTTFYKKVEQVTFIKDLC